jgi:DNA (cytosine-5)-methyltransferase 1
LKVLDLFSGIGGFSLGLEAAGMETIAFCEIEKYPRKVLAKHWPDIPIASDVTKLTYKDGVLYDNGEEIYRGTVDVICGGFPCQDLSNAGRKKGITGERSGLWSECARLIREVQPRFAIYENVSALLSGERGAWFQRVLSDISEVGYDAEWHCIPASAIGAPHRRDRVWIVAYPNSKREQSGYREVSKENGEISEWDESTKYSDSGKQSEVLAHTNNTRHTTHKDDSNGIGAKVKQERQEQPQFESSRCSENVADSSSSRSKARMARQEQRQEGQPRIANYLSNEIRRERERQRVEGWAIEPDVGRVANGIPDRTHRLKCLGNAVVPQIPEIIGKAIMDQHGS